MGSIRLDGVGTQKLKTLEDALGAVHHIHGMVERMAVDVKNNRGTGITLGQIKRTATNLQGQLKGQFSVIADQVAALILALGRGGGEQGKVRAARESVAQIRTALEIMLTKVREQHPVPVDATGE